MRAYLKRFDGTLDIAEAEAVGTKEAMRWLGEMNMKHEKIHFKSDCMQVVQAIYNEKTNHSELGSII
jgi:hypothetical protein